MDPPMTDVVLVHLEGVSAAPSDEVVPEAVTISGITAALEFDERGLAGRVRLLSALDDLKQDDVLVECEREVMGVSGERTVYFLTDHGRERARGVRERYVDDVVTVRDDDEVDVRLGEIDEYLPEPALPRALSRVTDDDVIHLDEASETFVNRTAELETVESVLETAKEDGARGVLVAGEAGIGKTTLVTDEVAARADDAGFDVHVGGSRAGATEPYAPIREILAERSDESSPFGATGVDDVPGAEQYDAERRTMFDEIATRFEDAAAESPLFIVLEDLHLAGEPTVELAGHVVDTVDAPLVLVVTYRPADLDDDHPIPRIVADIDSPDVDTSSVHIELDRFDDELTRRLLEKLVERSSVPGAFATEIHEHTGGNPLFVEETVTAMMADGTVDPNSDVFPTDASALPMPESVGDAVDLRLEVLDDDTSAVLDVAAVIGQTVPRDVLEATLEQSTSTLRTHVELLADARLLERVDADTLRFVSGLVRESCVERIESERRRTLHAQIADAYETCRGDDPEVHASIAHHRQAAGEYEAAFDAYLSAGEHDIDVYAADTAVESYQTAVTLATEELSRPPDDEDVLEALEQIATAKHLLDDYEGADRHLQYVAERTRDDDRRRSVARIRALLWRERGDYQHALEIIEAAIDDVEFARSEDSALLADVKGFVHGKREEYEAAEAAYERGAAIARDVGDEDLVTRLERSKAMLGLDRRAVDEEMIAVQEEKLAEAREEGDERAEGIELLNLGLALEAYGDLERAESVTREAVEMFESQGTEMTACDARNTLGVVLRVAGKWEEARQAFEQALETARRVDNERIVVYGHTNLAELLLDRGELEGAQRHVETGLALAEDMANPHYWTDLANTAAELALERDEPDRARELTEDALDRAREAENDALEVQSLGVLGAVERAAGNLERARETLETGVARASESQATDADEEAPLHVGLAWTTLEAGDAAGALEHARAAMTVAEDATEDDASIEAQIVVGASHRARDEFDAAEAALTDALEDARAGGWRLLEYHATYRLARLDAARGATDAATARVRDLEATAADHGATRLEDLCRAELAAQDDD